jgi:hypothetical protein
MRCTALNAKKQRCGSLAITGAMSCYFHSRTKAEQLEMARAGGKAKAAKYRRETRCRCSECGDVHVSRKKRRTLPTSTS